MKKISRKHFMEELTENKSILVIAQFLKCDIEQSKNAIEKWLKEVDTNFYTQKEKRQGYKHSNGLKFKTQDGTFSYISLGGGNEYYQANDLLILLKENTYFETNFVIYQVIRRGYKMEKIKKVLMEEISNKNLADLVSECNSWNGSFEHLERYDMEYDLDMFIEGNNAHWLACRIYYGNFKPIDDYFNFDGYGNLKSFGEYEYNQMISDEKEEIIETALELHKQGDIDIQWIIDEYVEQ